MHFDLTDEQQLLEQTVREWAGREVAPRIRDLDRAHRFDRGLLPQMAELGLLGVSVPAEYGGAGMDYISLGLASEELEYVDTSLRVIMSVHVGLNCLTLLVVGHRGSEAAVSGAAGAGHEDRDLRPDRAGRPAATRAAFRPMADRRRAIATSSPARRCGSRSPTSPTTSSCSPGRDLEKKKQRDPSGMSAFIVERAFKGFSSGTLTEKWGILAGNTGFFKMDDVEVPEENSGRPRGRRASRSRCSRSTRAATPSPPARPA